MNSIVSFLVEVTLTLLVSVLIVRYMRPFLRKVLVDLCGTEDRAQFWTAFSNVMLVGLPMILALTYQPEASDMEGLFFEVLRKLGWNLAGLLVALVGVGFSVAFFAMFAPKPAKVESI